MTLPPDGAPDQSQAPARTPVSSMSGAWVRTAAALVITAALATVNGCSPEVDETSQQPSVETQSDAYDSPPGPQAGPTLRRNDAANSKLLGERLSGPWTLAAPPDPRSAAIEIWREDGGCLIAGRPVTHEDEARVVIAVPINDVRAPDTVCTAELRYTPATVTLTEALGSRVLVHAWVDPALFPQ